MVPKCRSNIFKYVLMFVGVLVPFIIVQYGYMHVWNASKVDIKHNMETDESDPSSKSRVGIDIEASDNKQVVLGNSEYFQWQGTLPDVGKLSEATSKQHVLINSYMSCGSRFTGQFFGNRNDSFYFYEPLWYFNMLAFYDEPDLECDVAGPTQACRKITGTQLNTMPSNKLPKGGNLSKENKFYQKDVSNSSVTDILIDVLTDMYNCRFDRLLNIVVDEVHAEETLGGPSWKEYRLCMKDKTNTKLECLKRLEKVCKKADHVVTKVLRITTGSLDRLMEHVHNLKVIHLYRDPRAIINSRREWKGYPINDGFDNAKKLCDKMMVDLVGGLKLINKFPDRVKFVFYEDLTSDVEYKTKQLYKFLGMDASLMTFEHAKTLKKIVNVAPEESEVAKLLELRKQNNAFWWRQNLPYNVYGIIHDQCFKISMLFNLTYYDNENTLHNMDIPSMNLPKLFVIL